MYHVRQLDDTGFTTRQLPTNFLKLEDAKAAAKKEERKTGDVHTVCESLTHTDPRNVKGEGRFGFAPVTE